MNAPWWYSWGGLNDRLFLAINHAGSGWAWDHLARWATIAADHGVYPIWTAALLALAIKRPTALTQRAVLNFTVAYLLDWAIVGPIKVWLNFPRPPLALGLSAVHVIGAPQFQHSFPSGHTAFAFTLLASLLPGAHWVLRSLLLIFALWVAWARIAMGAHFPADVLGGALAGLLASWLATRLLGLAGYSQR